MIGGIVLAYPFWSAGYASLQQDRLAASLVQSQRKFDHIISSQTASIERIANRNARLRALATVFAQRLHPGDTIGRILIPRLHLNRVILDGEHKPPSMGIGNDQQYLRDGPTHYGLTPLPGTGRPFAVAGHRTTYGAPFNKLNELRRGDAIYVVTPYARLRYRVDKETVVRPTEISVLADRGYDLVLTTCDPPGWATRRLIVWGTLVDFSLRS
jgi:sortase A